MKASINKFDGVAVAYIELSDDSVEKTIEFSDNVLLDLDRFDCVRGIELLSLTESPRLSDLKRVAHIKAEHEVQLEYVLNNLNRFTMTRGNLTAASRLVAEDVEANKLESC